MATSPNDEPRMMLAREELVPAGAPAEEFVREFTKHQRRLFIHILAQVFRPADAEEILQESNVVALRKHHQFEVGTNFFAWMAQIATYEVLRFRQKRRREKLQFSDELLQSVASEDAERTDDWDLRLAALKLCMSRLRPADRQLIEARYRPEEMGKEVADRLGRPANSVYQSIGRIRKTLWECIRRQLAAEAML